MKLGLIFAACLLVAGCGAAASVDSSEVPNTSAEGGSSTGSGGDSATGTSSGDDAASGDPEGGSSSGGDSGSSSGDDGGSPAADSGSGGDDGGSTTADSGSGGGDDGGTPSTDSGSGGDDGGVTVADSGNGGSVDSGSGGGDDGGTTTTDSGSGGSSDSGSGGSTDSGSGGNSDGGQCSAPKCVLTQGYYKNHPSNWSVLPVVMGTNDYSESQCLTLLNDPSVGDASLILAKQYIAAVENGGLCDPNASALMAQAQAWFTNNQNGSLPYGISLPVSGCASDHTSVPCQAYWLGQSLDSYNNGLSGTPACQ